MGHDGAAKNIPSTLVGDGYFMNCGPEKLRLNTAYVIFAFEAEITSKDTGIISINYGFDVVTVYKGAAENIPSTLLGHGTLFSCGPQMLDLNTKYLIFATINGENIQILTYRKMADVKPSDIERITTNYDCNCTININYAAFHGAQSPPLPEPSKNECNAPEDFCSRSGYCQKNSDGVCTWGDKGDCY
uniref:Uncharacterized protein n=1 Tax=Magallana gigas TaxID=29159 RepID=K1QVN5_MAGGI